MLRSAAHETYHFVEGYSKKDADDLRDYVIDALKGNGVDIDKALEKYAKHPEYDTREKQISELVADSMFDVFSNEDFIKNLTAKNQTLAKRLANKIGEWVKEIRNAIKLISVRGDNPEIKALMDDAEKLDTIRNMLLEGYKNAGENFKAEQAEGQKNTAEGTAVKNKYSFKTYSEQQLRNWENSKRIVVYKNNEQFADFIIEAINQKNNNKKLYFGAIGNELAIRIEENTGINVVNYNCSLSAYEIKKILKDHGNESKERQRGQRAVTQEDFLEIPNVILDADKIKLSEKEYNGKPAIEFIKRKDNERKTVVAVVSDDHMDLFVQTSYINIKKGNLAVPTDEQASVNTPKANNGTVSTNSIPKTIKSVKQNLSVSDSEYTEQKQSQLDIINKTNPAPNTYSTWIRTVDDIKTLAETLEDDEWDYEEFNPDLTREDIQNAIESGEITVYSSYPIENGVFVSPSRMEAESYSGNGNVYEKTVDINDVAWIDPTQGQYAKVDNGQVFSRKQTDPIQAHYAEVMRENRNLKNIISALDEMQYSSARNNIHLDGRDIHNIAGRLLKSASSKYELKAFEDELTAVYDYMANGKEVDTEAVFQSILGIANRVLEKSEMKDTELYEQYKNSAEFSLINPQSFGQLLF